MEYLQYIDENLSNVLTEIGFEGCDWDATRKWKNIFTKVEKVSLKQWGPSPVGFVNIHKFFPNIRVLELYTDYVYTPFIQYNFPHLEEFIYTGYSDVTDDIMRTLGKLLPLNQQMKRISVSRVFDKNLLQFINENAPNLQQLDVSGVSLDSSQAQTNDPVRFENVKSFSLNLGMYGQLENIFFAFDQLEEITGFHDIQTELKQEWSDWIIENKQLKKISMRSDYVNYHQWSNFAKQLPSLIEACGSLWSQFEDQQIAGLLTDDNQLKKVTIHAEECEKLIELSQPGWDIVDKNQCKSNNSITFVRQLN